VARSRIIAAAAALAGAALVATALAVATPAQAAGGVAATFSKDSDWGTGYQGKYTIANGSASTLTSWTITFDLPAGVSMGSYWDALVTVSGQHVTAKNRDYNGTVAPGGTASFGFIASGGSGAPVNCTINGGSCSAGATTSPTATRTTTSPTPTSSPTPTPTGSSGTGTTLAVAPYIDMGSWPTPVLPDVATASTLKNFTLAFITASGCKAMWFNAYDPRTAWDLADINAIRARGGDVKISFGGASGIELAQACSSVSALTAEYQAVINAYSLKYIDFDIEGSAVAEPASISLRSQAMKQLQNNNPNLKISLTLPVLPTGLDNNGLNVLNAAKNAGVNIDVVNVMAMDYQQGGDYGPKAIQAAQSTFSQLQSVYPGKTAAQLWRMIGVTPMLGKNDDGGTFDQTGARNLVSFARTNHVGELSFWEVTRDRNACNGALYQCTNVPQSPYEFSKIFAGYTG
jgi:Cellulose binding domain/Glycosyl hydrolases family 18